MYCGLILPSISFASDLSITNISSPSCWNVCLISSDPLVSIFFHKHLSLAVLYASFIILSFHFISCIFDKNCIKTVKSLYLHSTVVQVSEAYRAMLLTCTYRCVLMSFNVKCMNGEYPKVNSTYVLAYV